MSVPKVGGERRRPLASSSTETSRCFICRRQCSAADICPIENGVLKMRRDHLAQLPMSNALPNSSPGGVPGPSERAPRNSPNRDLAGIRNFGYWTHNSSYRGILQSIQQAVLPCRLSLVTLVRRSNRAYTGIAHLRPPGSLPLRRRIRYGLRRRRRSGGTSEYLRIPHCMRQCRRGVRFRRGIPQP